MAPKTAPETGTHRGPARSPQNLLSLAPIGRDYICDELPLVYHRDSFKILTRIAEHPRYSKRVRSLFYMVDQWYADRPDPRPLKADKSFWDHLQPGHTERDFRAFLRGENKYYEDRQARIAAVPMEDRQKGYEAHCTLCQDQYVLSQEAHDLAGTSHSLFDMTTRRGMLTHHRLTEVMKPLRRLSLIIPTDGYDDSSDDEAEYPMLSIQVFEQGFVRRVLAQCGELRILKLSISEWDRYNPVAPDYTRLEHALKHITYPHLYELALCHCAVRADILVELLMRHKATLRRLSLSDVILQESLTSWREVFTRISGQLPNLCRVTLRGRFGMKAGQPRFNFDPAPEMLWETTYASPRRDAMESFIVNGGEYHSDDLPLQIDDPGEDYVPPRLSVDRKEPDDPALDYEWDEFDDQFLNRHIDH